MVIGHLKVAETKSISVYVGAILVANWYAFDFIALPTVFKPDSSGSLPIFLAELERMAGLY